MRYHDLRIYGMKIASRFEHNTDELSPEAVALFQGMLRTLRRGEMQASHGLPDLPDVALRLGLPDSWANGDRPGRFFCIGRADTVQDSPFSVNLLLRPDRDLPGYSALRNVENAFTGDDSDARALATLFGLTNGGRTLTEAQTGPMWQQMQEVWDLRCGKRAAPVLLTALGPRNDGDLMLISLSADASTLTAAALLIEGEGAGER